MTNRTRNLSILGVVLLLLAAAGFVIATKSTRLGLDLKGGTELVYQGQPTPQVPTVTPQALDDALNTIRKRTDALGVSEPEIQRSGRDQISIGLPDVQNAQRAIDQVGSTAQLQFYDWEANVLGDRGPDAPYAGSKALYEAVDVASKQKPKAEKDDVPPGSDLTPEEADKQNDSTGDQYYLFGPDHLPIGPDKQPLREGKYDPSSNCKDLLSDYDAAPGPPNKYAKDTECKAELDALGPAGPPDGTRVIKVPQGIVVLEAEPAPNQSARVQRFFVIEDDSELNGKEIKNPEQNFDPNTKAPLVTMEFTDKGRQAFATVTKRLADRGRDCQTLAGVSPNCPNVPAGAPPEDFFQRFAITLDNQIVSLATIDFQDNPEGIDGRTGASIENIGTIQQAQDLAESLRIGALPIDLKLISQTQVSATLGKQALNQGLTAARRASHSPSCSCSSSTACSAWWPRWPCWSTRAPVRTDQADPDHAHAPGHRGYGAHTSVAADANIVMFERIKEEVRTGNRSRPPSPPVTPRASHDYRRQRRDASACVHPVHSRHGGRPGLRVHARCGNDRVAVHGGARDFRDPRPGSHGWYASERARRGPRKSKGWKFDFMGKSKRFFSFSGSILATGAIAFAGLGHELRHRLRAGTRITVGARTAGQRIADPQSSTPLGYGDAKIQRVNDPELGTNVFQIDADTRAGPGDRGRGLARQVLRRGEGRLHRQLGRSDLRRVDRAHARDRDPPH